MVHVKRDGECKLLAHSRFSISGGLKKTILRFRVFSAPLTNSETTVSEREPSAAVEEEGGAVFQSRTPRCRLGRRTSVLQANSGESSVPWESAKAL